MSQQEQATEATVEKTPDLNMDKYKEGKKAALKNGTLLTLVREQMPPLGEPWRDDQQELDALSYILGFGDGVLQQIRG